MSKHNRHGFTIVELIVVIVVIALLATISTVAYRTTQASARDEKRKADAMMLMSAVDEYYANYGAYPVATSSCSGPGGANECWNNEVWQVLTNEGFLQKVPTPDLASPNSGYNVDDGKSNYGWMRGAFNEYAIYIPLETHDSKHCKIVKNAPTSWWSSIPTCDFL